MPDHIGKYEVIERIGRGGMGTIYKAHDPILDRFVALKVISTEVEVTDELRTRFFREAQACAKLNHPNIVTVYDMGEDDGRLYFVMELLEGQELRRLIGQGATMPLEDKLSVIVQVCGGLYYAHQRGIVHRDVKPGNIFVLASGQVKILDFGIAHMAATEGLTRTGLIMGTLRYISPEQVRGRSDQRSDMFSLGSVLYELLTSRPPFTGEDPMHLLEQIRAEDPPPLSEVNANLPGALTGIVQRAMRKNPAERFRDLDEMRAELERVQRDVQDERYQVMARVRSQRERIAQLQSALAERLSTSARDAEIPGIEERRGLVGIQELERELASRIAALEAEIAQTDAMAPVVQRAEALMKAGQFDDAAAEFETIVQQVPDYRWAREGLDRARAEADLARRRRQGEELAERVRAALLERRYGLCLEILGEAAGLELPSDLGEGLASLRERVLAEQEAEHRRRREAEEAREQTEGARAAAQAAAAPQYAPAKWSEAQGLADAAEAGLGRGAHAEAKQGFDRALAAYQIAQEAAQQAQAEERRNAERGREAATLDQQQARAAGAPQYAADLWSAGTTKFDEAQTAFARKPTARVTAAFTEASGLYRRAKDAAQAAQERERRRAQAARERAEEGRHSAEALDAEHRAPEPWREASDQSRTGEAAWLRNQYPAATEAFEAALALYHRAQSQVREAARRLRDESARQGQQMGEARREASAVEAAVDAPAEWADAEAAASVAEAALERNAWEEASAEFERARELYRGAEARARETRQARGEAERALAATAAAREAAAAVEASKFAPEPWKDAEDSEARAVTAFSQQRYDSARAVLAEAEGLYADAQHAAQIVRGARAVEAPPTVGRAARPGVGAAADGEKTVLVPRRESSTARPRRLLVGAVAGTLGIAAAVTVAVSWRTPTPAPVRPVEQAPPPTAVAPRPPEPTPAPSVTEPPQSRSPATGDDTARATALARRITEVKLAEGQAAEARRSAELAEAPTRAASPWARAGAAQRGAEDALKQEEYDKARSLFGDARKGYQDAEREATAGRRDQELAVLKRELEDAEKARRAMVAARQEHETASRQVPALYAAAQKLEAEGDAALNGKSFTTARQRFVAAQDAYKRAGQEGERLTAVEKNKAAADQDRQRQVEQERQRQAELERQRQDEARHRAEATAARTQMAEAKKAATTVGADRYAAKLLAAASSKEREGQAAFDKNDWGLADRQFRAAISDYQGAAREADVQVGALKSTAEQSRGRAVARRDQAVKAEADRLAKDVFEAAAAKQGEADGQMKTTNFTAATQSYQDAADRFVEAGMRAQVARDARNQADAAKAKMLGEKGRAREDAPDYRSALAEERQGAALYERLAFKEAAEKFVAAERLFTKAAPGTTPEPSGSTPAPRPQPQRPGRTTPPPF